MPSRPGYFQRLTCDDLIPLSFVARGCCWLILGTLGLFPLQCWVRLLSQSSLSQTGVSWGLWVVSAAHILTQTKTKQLLEFVMLGLKWLSEQAVCLPACLPISLPACPRAWRQFLPAICCVTRLGGGGGCILESKCPYLHLLVCACLVVWSVCMCVCVCVCVCARARVHLSHSYAWSLWPFWCLHYVLAFC